MLDAWPAVKKLCPHQVRLHRRLVFLVPFRCGRGHFGNISRRSDAHMFHALPTSCSVQSHDGSDVSPACLAMNVWCDFVMMDFSVVPLVVRRCVEDTTLCEDEGGKEHFIPTGCSVHLLLKASQTGYFGVILPCRLLLSYLSFPLGCLPSLR